MRLTCSFFMSLAVLSGSVALGDELRDLTAAAGAPARFTEGKPAFTVTTESFSFKADKKEKSFRCIKDRGRYIAILDEGMAQLDMITFRPDGAVEKPPFKDYYSWGTLLGTRLLVSAWIGGMSQAGPVTYAFSEGGETLTLRTEQTWKERKGACRYDLTLRLDPAAGYVWDIKTDYATDKPVIRNFTNNGIATSEVERTEFFNWQVQVTGWTNRHNNPRWPAKWTHERTVFQRASDGAYVGFYMNPEAVDRSRFKRTEVKEGGFVAMGPDASGWGIALAHLRKAGFSTFNATCNMWGDSHNYLAFRKDPDADGFYRVSGEWRFQAVPPEVMRSVLGRTEMDGMGR